MDQACHGKEGQFPVPGQVQETGWALLREALTGVGGGGGAVSN